MSSPVKKVRNQVAKMESLRAGYARLPGVMAQMGYASLRAGQEPVIVNILAERDTLCILPTSTGKTACFVIPTLCMNWKTIVFSPLVALMRDQVQGLNAKGIRAAAVSSMQTDAENQAIIKRWAEGDLQFIYVAPERLHNNAFRDAITRVPPNMVVMDEAHCLSQWSDTFRSSYCLVGDFIQEQNPQVVAAFTATCPREAENDIRRVLRLEHAQRLFYYPRRKNLILSSSTMKSETQIADHIFNTKGATIVYCSTIKKLEQTARMLQDSLREDVLTFHGQMSPTDKRVNQDLFMNDKIRVMVATNAFGMGVDKGNIRSVVHRDIPGSLEALAQELGRAGRDGKDSQCMTFYAPDSYETQQFFIAAGHPTKSEIASVLRVLQQASDLKGVSQLTLMDISRRTNLFSKKLDPIFEILKSSKVVEREGATEKIGRIRLDENTPTDDDRFQTWWDIISNYGMEEDGFYKIDLNWLSDHIGLEYPTILKHLKRWDSESVIRFLPPYRGSLTKIIGSIEQIDFERLELRARQAHAKLEQVMGYIRSPDADKHAYLEAYFDDYKNE